MKRRLILQWGTAMLALPGIAFAQHGKQFRIGVLWATDEASVQATQAAFVAGLRDHGYVPGRNLVIDVRHARGDESRVPVLADELIALRPDFLVGIQAPALVMRAKTTTIPIVLLASPDPVAAGLVQSVARPGTNVTGNAFRQDELIGKQIELLAEVRPAVSRVALLNYAARPAEPLVGVAQRYSDFARGAASEKGLKLTIAAARDIAGVRDAFSTIEREQAQGVVVVPTAPMYQLRNAIVESTRRLRLPSISAMPDGWLQAGGLLNYGPDFVKAYRHAASFVDRILKGTSPAEIPIEYPRTFELSVNLKAAREIGITVPRSIVARADRVIE